MSVAESARLERHTAGLMQYELEDGSIPEECHLNCYLPKGVAGKDVELSYDVDSLQAKGCICIHFDTQAQALGCVELEGYAFPGEIHAKFSKKQGKYTFRLLRQSVPKPVESSDDEDRDSTVDQDVHVHEHFSDAASSGPCTPTATDQSAGTLQSQQQQDVEEQQSGERDAEQDAVLASTVGPPQLLTSLSEAAELQQGGSKPGSAAAEDDDGDDDDDEEEENDDDAAEGDDDQAAGAGQDAAAKKTKKRRGQKKKKKKKSKAAQAAGEGGGSAESSAPAEAAAAGATGAEASAATAADDEEEFVDALSEGVDDAAESSDQQAAAASPRAKGSRSSRASAGSAAAAVVTISTDDYLSCFSEEPVAGTTQLPTPGGEPLLLPGSLKHGPTVAACLDKHEVKGEDKGLKVIGATWTPSGSSASASFSAFGIFDGHGGKSAATFSSKELLPTVTRLLDRCIASLPATPGAALPKLGRLPSEAMAAAAAAGDDPDDDRDWGITVTDEDKEVWAAQEALVDRLPQAMFAGFLEADKTCSGKFKTSGTTATLAIVSGWDLLVANVGDSLAFLDTGREVIALSGNHRIDDNPAERARIEAAGGEVAKSTVDGKPVGPDRVWPGGLAMSRTIGDPQATHVIAAPEIRHVTLPTTGGRLIIASDGVWDHMQPKSMIHQVRNDNTDAAAKKISVAAMKKKGLKDDISVLVVDLLPAAGEPRPPALLPGPVREAVEPVQIIWPLTEESSSTAVNASRGNSAGGLTTATSITSVTTISNSHWRDNAASRRAVALQLLRRQARQEAEAAAAEAARLARLAAEAEAQASNANLSDTYRELAQLRIDPSIVVEEVKQHQQQLEAQEVAAQEAAAAPATAAEDEEGWTTVGPSSSNAESGNGYVSFEQQMQAAVRGGRPAGRGDRVGRSRGRGRGREHFARSSQQPEDFRFQKQHQQERGGADEHDEGGYVRDSNGFDGRGRGGRGRGRGRRSINPEVQGSQEQQPADQFASHQDMPAASRAAAAAADAIDKVRVVPRPHRASLDRRSHKQQQQQQLDEGGAGQEQQQVLPMSGYVHANGGPAVNGGAYHAEDKQQERPLHVHSGPSRSRGRGRGRGRFDGSKLSQEAGEAAGDGAAAGVPDVPSGHHGPQQLRPSGGGGMGFRGGRPRGGSGYKPGGRGPAGYDGSSSFAGQAGPEGGYEMAPSATDNGAAAAGSDFHTTPRARGDGGHERGRGGRGGSRGRGYGGRFEGGRSGEHPSHDRFRGSERGGYRGGRSLRGGRGRGEAAATAPPADYAPVAQPEHF